MGFGYWVYWWGLGIGCIGGAWVYIYIFLIDGLGVGYAGGFGVWYFIECELWFFLVLCEFCVCQGGVLTW